MALEGDIESMVLDNLREQGPCTIDELSTRLHNCTWNQVFTIVDRLSRDGRLQLQHPTPSVYVVLLGSQAKMPRVTFDSARRSHSLVRHREGVQLAVFKQTHA